MRWVDEIDNKKRCIKSQQFNVLLRIARTAEPIHSSANIEECDLSQENHWIFLHKATKVCSQTTMSSPLSLFSIRKILLSKILLHLNEYVCILKDVRTYLFLFLLLQVRKMFSSFPLCFIIFFFNIFVEEKTCVIFNLMK